jgi:hypothetical protein
VAKYMAGRRQPPSQGWKTFLRNHANGIAWMDLFVVPTISFRLVYGFRSDGIVLTMLLCSANGISAHLLKSYQKYYNEASYAPIAAQGRDDLACCPDCRSHAGDRFFVLFIWVVPIRRRAASALRTVSLVLISRREGRQQHTTTHNLVARSEYSLISSVVGPEPRPSPLGRGLGLRAMRNVVSK